MINLLKNSRTKSYIYDVYHGFVSFFFRAPSLRGYLLYVKHTKNVFYTRTVATFQLNQATNNSLRILQYIDLYGDYVS